MEDRNNVPTPASSTPLGIDKDGKPFEEDWEYATLIGILIYLAQNSRPDIAYAVHQYAHFTPNLRSSHARWIKRVLRYLKGTRDKESVITRPPPTFQIDCYVDTYFAGLWNVEHDQDPIYVKS